MTIDISDNNPRISYTANANGAQTAFAVPFEFFDNADLNVYIASVLKSEGTGSTNYGVSGGSGSTGTVTFVSGVTASATVVITRSISIERVTDFTAGADINRAALNTQLDTLTAITADLKDTAARALQLTDSDTAASLEIPILADRKGKSLGFHSTSGNPEAIEQVTGAAVNVSTVSVGGSATATVAVSGGTATFALGIPTGATGATGPAGSGDMSDLTDDTSPQLGGNLDTNSHNILIDDAHFIGDESGNEQIVFQTTGSAVNYLEVTNNAAGSNPILSAAGGDTNVGIALTPKGTGEIVIAAGNLNYGGTAVTSTGAELNTLDALSRGSILYGNASAATTVLTKGSANTVLTSDGTDISWAAAAGGPSYARSTTPPGSPTAGDWWLNTNSNQQSPFIYDGTLGWIQGDGTALGFSSYLAVNSFSLRVRNNGVVDVVRFADPIPQISADVASYTDNTASPVATSNTVRAVLKVNDSSNTNAYQFVIFANLGAAANFGDTVTTSHASGGAISHATRGIFMGGAGPVNHMEYITIGTAGNGTDFGDLTVARTGLNNACVASTTRGIILGGNGGSATNVIDYVTIAAPSNATDFGDLTAVTTDTTSVHSTTRGVRISGGGGGNVMDYITMASAGNATDFGDLGSTSNSDYIQAIHNGTYGWMNQYAGATSGLKQQITIATAANASEISDGSGPFARETAPTSNVTTAFAKGWIAASG